jgi:ribosomal protein S18 acetylase RimI-like enzyme
MPPETVFVRSIHPDDAHHVAVLLTELGYPSDEGAVAGRIERLHRAPALGFVAVRSHRPVGMATVTILTVLTEDAPIAKLSSLVVAPESRGQGVGRALVRHAMAQARDRGCARMTLTTHLRRTEAHAFYERLGFELTGRRYVIAL